MIAPMSLRWISFKGAGRPVGPRIARDLGLLLPQAWGWPVGSRKWMREYYTLRGRWIGSVHVAEFRRFYNFGNAVRQWLNMLDWCEQNGIKKIFIPENLWFVAGPLGDVTLVPAPKGSIGPRRLVGTFFYPRTLSVHWSSEKRASNLRRLRVRLNPDLIQSGLDVQSKKTLTVHLRSGDVFEARPHPDYAPPPLIYIIESMWRVGADSLVAVAQDRQHPFLEPLSLYCASQGIAFRVQCSSLQEDLAHLMGATNLCLTQGTMGLAAAWLSPVVESVFVFGRTEIEELVSLEVAVDVATVPSESARNVFGIWTNSPEQLVDLLDLSGPAKAELSWLTTRPSGQNSVSTSADETAVRPKAGE
jgi:hypothetical protein